MNDYINIIKAFFVGIALGTIFFGGLWVTVRNVANSKIKSFWIACSFFLRIIITLSGFYFFYAGNFQKLLISVLGFIVARFIIMHITKLMDKKQLKKSNQL